MIAWTIATIGGTLHHVKRDDIIQALPDFGLASYNRLTRLRRIGESLPSTLRVYQLPRVGDRHLEVPRDAPIHPFVHPYQIVVFLIEEILQCPRIAPIPSSATVLDRDVQHLGIETGSHGRRSVWGIFGGSKRKLANK